MVPPTIRLHPLVVVALLAAPAPVHARTAAPPPPPAGIRVVVRGDLRIELDLRSQVLGIALAENSEARAADVPLTARPAGHDLAYFLPASVLAQKAKVFDDGLVAAAELAAERGHGTFPSKAALIATVARALAADGGAGEAHEVLLAAARLGGLDVAVPDALAGAVERRIAWFHARPALSQPLGVYTGSPELARLFQQDRMLQSDLAGADDLGALVDALRGDAGATRAYAAALAFHAGLTGPPAHASLAPLLAGAPRPDTIAFLPASTTHESELAKRLFPGAVPPPDFPLARVLAERVRAGEVVLAPGPASGWYDHQAWALEPLLSPERMPEAAKLETDSLYRATLLELFEALLGLTRETHVKQAETPILMGVSVGPRVPPVHVFPELTVEPLAEHYRRRAEAYAFVRAVLERAFGPAGLGSLHRFGEAGPVAAPLDAELDTLTALHHGAYLRTCRELGLAPAPLPGRDAARDEATFDGWRAGVATDPDLATDIRMMVPVYVDGVRGTTHVWAVLGWSRHRLHVHFQRPPVARVLDARGRPSRVKPELRFVPEAHDAPYPVFVELDVRRVLDRAAFRALCDRERTRERILAALR